MKTLQVIPSQLKQVLIIVPPTIFQDHRGMYIETFNKEIYKNAGIDIEFLQDDISISKKNVLRGIHGDNSTWKLVSCLKGEIQLIVVNYDSDSNEYMKWTSIRIGESNLIQVLIPPKFGNGHLVLSEFAIFNYKQSTYYDRNSQFSIKWNDQRFNFSWLSTAPILSHRDS